MADAKNKKVSTWQEFKNFAFKGNIVDLSVGVVIGSAFGKVTSSLVSDIIMPVIGLLTGGVSFTDMQVVLKQAVGKEPAVILKYGAFIDTIVNLLIIAAAIFFAIKAVNKIRILAEEAIASSGLIDIDDPAASAPAAPVLTPDQKLLVEIRDLLLLQAKAQGLVKDDKEKAPEEPADVDDASKMKDEPESLEEVATEEDKKDSDSSKEVDSSADSKSTKDNSKDNSKDNNSSKDNKNS